MQRRRRPKVAPRNVFGGNIPPRPQKKSKEFVVKRNDQKQNKVTTNSPIPPKVIREQEQKTLSENEKLINKSKEFSPLIEEKDGDLEDKIIEKDVIIVENKILEENILGSNFLKKLFIFSSILTLKVSLGK